MKTALGLVAVLALSAPAVALDDEPLVATLTVRGDAELQKPADQLRIRISVVTEGFEAQATLEENSRRTDDVVDALRMHGLRKGEYQTGRFSISPRYSARPRNAGPDWHRQIIGYEVTNSLAIKTAKLDLAGKLIQSANEAGANSIDSIVFDLADPRAHRNEAISAATAHAISDAGVLAESASLRLVRIISIDLDDARRSPPVPTMARAEMMAVAAAPAPPIVPGEITVRAGVTIVYEIAPPN